jgi:hypothetical protein
VIRERHLSASVLNWRRPAGEPVGLWERIAELGWLPDGPRYVLQMGRRGRSSIAVETARSLVRFLSEYRPNAPLEVLNPEAHPDDWAGLPISRIGDGEPIVLTGIAASELTVPGLWFEAYTLVTMAEPVPCRRSRLACVLDAQAEPLRRLGNRYAAAVLAYEGHRLAPSDLVVACGNAAGERWWSVGPNDIAVENVVGSAAGATARLLPSVRAIGRHECLPEVQCLGEPLPALEGCLASAWSGHATAAFEHCAGTARSVARDAVTIRRNLGKIPSFVRRRLASRARGAA